MQLWLRSEVSYASSLAYLCFLQAPKPEWFLSDAHWQRRGRTNHMWGWLLSVFAAQTPTKLLEVWHMSGWTNFTSHQGNVCVCVCVSHPKVTFHQTAICHVILLSGLETLMSDRARVSVCVCVCECVNVCLQEVWICGGADNARCVSSCRCLVPSGLHTATHTLFPLPSNLSCPELLSAIHFPVSQPSITPARPQMQPSLLKMKRGSYVYTGRHRLRQPKREGGAF